MRNFVQLSSQSLSLNVVRWLIFHIFSENNIRKYVRIVVGKFNTVNREVVCLGSEQPKSRN